MELRVCPTCLALVKEGHEHETVTITVDYETKTVKATGRIAKGEAHEFLLSVIEEHAFKKKTPAIYIRNWVEGQLETWRSLLNVDLEKERAKVEKSREEFNRSVERINAWVQRQPDKASAQRWAEKKISQLKANLESIERDFERLVKAVERTIRMLGVEK
jgi:hypothetical protein